ncbi:MAG: hypothetical protein ING66_16930 [Rhodocyclaceae bacterium]|nr:hypothetical protein [Rhodocyclaceae bacterium]MCA3025669.1 hypothetical protein [Rhodocyclaceae bacterium]MCA3030268.1 hypothetical protein [Rhodocyclaceae bacterium]MCA3034296.1 hypothetical protein [Rhodocyclaceae bacterium]MCA3036423.1 hypothetical protein [Rhodocyclaceae bacterium]
MIVNLFSWACSLVMAAAISLFSQDQQLARPAFLVIPLLMHLALVYEHGFKHHALKSQWSIFAVFYLLPLAIATMFVIVRLLS